jgi:hypothetical protein
MELAVPVALYLVVVGMSSAVPWMYSDLSVAAKTPAL